MSKRLFIGIAVLLCWSSYTSAAVVENPSNLTQPSATNDEFAITCDGPAYGFSLDPEDCLSALQRFIERRDIIEFAERDTPHKTGDMIPLPWRWMGGILYSIQIGVFLCDTLMFSLAKPSCYIQPVLKPGVHVAKSPMYNIREAAYALTRRCAAAQNSGGIANNIGES
ncbi:MAG: hypothetical protein Q9181_005923 [Wetmoreana brouardii]